MSSTKRKPYNTEDEPGPSQSAHVQWCHYFFAENAHVRLSMSWPYLAPPDEDVASDFCPPRKHATPEGANKLASLLCSAPCSTRAKHANVLLSGTPEERSTCRTDCLYFIFAIRYCTTKYVVIHEGVLQDLYVVFLDRGRRLKKIHVPSPQCTAILYVVIWLKDVFFAA